MEINPRTVRACQPRSVISFGRLTPSLLASSCSANARFVAGCAGLAGAVATFRAFAFFGAATLAGVAVLLAVFLGSV